MSGSAGALGGAVDVRVEVTGADAAASEAVQATSGTAETARKDASRNWACMADSVRAAAPGVRLGIGGFEPWAGRPGEDAYAAARTAVYQWVAGSDSTFDAVGLVLHAGYDNPSEFDVRLAWAEEKLAELAPGKRAWVLECAGSPGVTGPLPQARHLRRVLAWAGGRPGVEGVCQTAFVDGPERAGLVSFLGRRRAAFDVFQGAGREGP